MHKIALGIFASQGQESSYQNIKRARK